MKELIKRGAKDLLNARGIAIALISIILYYLLFSPFLDTPIETELKRSERQLAQQLDTMRSDLETINRAYQSILERDRAIHSSLLGISPSILDQTHSAMVSNSYENYSTEELLEALKLKSRILETEVKEHTKLIDTLEQSMQNMGSRFSSIPSIQPIYNPLFDTYFVSSGMKINPFHKTPELHRGVDYGIKEGTRVYATADGIVSKMGSRVTNKGGLTVEIDHKNGYKTQYSNLSKSTVVQWRRVTKGDIIGYSGNTGYSFLPHLHYAVLYKGEYLRPEDFLFGEQSMMEYYNFYENNSKSVQAFD